VAANSASQFNVPSAMKNHYTPRWRNVRGDQQMKERRFRYRKTGGRQTRQTTQSRHTAYRTSRVKRRSTALGSLSIDYTALSGALILIFCFRILNTHYGTDQTWIAALWVLAGASAALGLSHLLRNSPSLSAVTSAAKYTVALSTLAASAYLFWSGVPEGSILTVFLVLISAGLLLLLSSIESGITELAEGTGFRIGEILLGITVAIALALLPEHWLNPPLALSFAGAVLLITQTANARKPHRLGFTGIALSVIIISVISQRTDHTALANAVIGALKTGQSESAATRPLWAFAGATDFNASTIFRQDHGLAQSCEPTQALTVSARLAGGARIVTPLQQAALNSQTNETNYLHNQRFIAAQLYDNAYAAALGEAAVGARTALGHFSVRRVALAFDSKLARELDRTMALSDFTTPHVEHSIHSATPRELLDRGRSQYDLILAPAPRSLSHNEDKVSLQRVPDQLHTVEGYSALFRRLSTGGALSYSWIESDNGWAHYYRALNTATEALRERGSSATSDHMFVLRNQRPSLPALITTLITPAPMTSDMQKTLAEIATVEGFEILASPTLSANTLIAEAIGSEYRYHSQRISTEHEVTFGALRDDRPFEGIFPTVLPDLVRPVYADHSAAFSAGLQNASRVDLFGAALADNKTRQSGFLIAALIPISLVFWLGLAPALSGRSRTQFAPDIWSTTSLLLYSSGLALSLSSVGLGRSLGSGQTTLLASGVLVGALLMRFNLLSSSSRERKYREQPRRRWDAFMMLGLVITAYFIGSEYHLSPTLLALHGLFIGSALSALEQKVARRHSDMILWKNSCALACAALTVGLALLLAPYIGLAVFALVSSILFFGATATLFRSQQVS
jgi:hypothetical protein